MENNKIYEQVDSKVVATQFIQFYYKELLNGVPNVLKCYSEDSTIKRFGGEDISGLDNIRAELERSTLTNVKIYKINSVYSYHNSVFLQVGAELTTTASVEKIPVIHNVLLVPRGPRSYYIHSDVVDLVNNLFDDGKTKPAQPLKHRNEVQKLLDRSLQNGISKPVEAAEPQVSPVKPAAPLPTAPVNAHPHAEPYQNGSHPKPVEAAVQPPSPRSPPKPIQEQPQAPPKPSGPTTWAKLVSGEVKNNGLPPPTKPVEQPKPVGFPAAKGPKPQQPQGERQQQRRDDKFEKNPRRLHFSYLRRRQNTTQQELEQVIRQAFEFLGLIEKVSAFGSDKWVNGYVEFKEECSVKTALDLVDRNTGKPGLQLQIEIPAWNFKEHVQISETPRSSSGPRNFNNRQGGGAAAQNGGSNGGWNNVGRRDNRNFRKPLSNASQPAGKAR
ncbi:unnamed protein product [Bursaphelenchus xylophilus]|nr:unnamed protein product [Bursaphelenchus xylophilus]CAG9114161.1 unnamed protein product [Bursaphelenchus xylophilus]